MASGLPLERDWIRSRRFHPLTPAMTKGDTPVAHRRFPPCQESTDRDGSAQETQVRRNCRNVSSLVANFRLLVVSLRR